MPRTGGIGQGAGGDRRVAAAAGTPAAAQYEPRAPCGRSAARAVPSNAAAAGTTAATAGTAPTTNDSGARMARPTLEVMPKMAINYPSQCSDPAQAGSIGAAQAAAGSTTTMTVDKAWESLGMRMRRYIIMQHGQIDQSSAREACELPWSAVRGAIESANDEFDADAADSAILATAGAGGGQS